MSSCNVGLGQEADAQFMETLRSRFEKAGFAFTADPAPETLPGFLGSYRPDALAQKPGQNIAIEVKRGFSPSASTGLTEICHLFRGQPDWHLQVIYQGADSAETLPIPAADETTIRNGEDEIRRLLTAREVRPAFVMSWSLLEAALRNADKETPRRPRPAGTVVQTLAMNGYITPDEERRLRALANVRNRIVHGDLVAEVSERDVESILSAIDATLSAPALDG